MCGVLTFINETMKKFDYCDRDIKPEDNLKNDLGLDSLGILTIVDEIEEKFQISLESDDLADTPQTVAELVKLIESKSN